MAWNQLRQWSGIACHNTTGAVLAVDLPNSSGRQPLGGEIRASLAKLKSLKHLDLSGNNFTGKIPHFLSSLENLQYLNLSYAGFSGAIPPNLGNLSSLQFLDVSYWGLTVDNLEWVSGLLSLKYLAMNSVDLSKLGGEWIEPLNKLPLLSELHLEYCGLSGFSYSLPSLNFTSLKVLNLQGSLFKAKLPTWLANISSLVSVDIGNSWLTGRIPLGFGELPNLQSLKLNYNLKLSASCFQLFARSWKKIQILDLSINGLHGVISEAHFHRLGKLEKISLSENSFVLNVSSIWVPPFQVIALEMGSCHLDPLTVKCSNDSNNGGDNYPDGGGKADQTDNGNGFIDKWFYMSIGVGFAAGLLLPYLVFAMKRSWGGVYFAFVDGTAYRLSSEKMKAAARRRNRGAR
ncbi:hypothetical protein GH714_030760 [Hevea brasiliensis]|uniref:Disease resistance R13L4/SHOC-2-like LRR domain-containing protein n=1 Tax=Hevea brasiliensis TaxID=3981 RepID=A0A6A6N897_HEVBR|nr:hypothetical protein GH714_030760 [Hevea brasiliensis]